MNKKMRIVFGLLVSLSSISASQAWGQFDATIELPTPTPALKPIAEGVGEEPDLKFDWQMKLKSDIETEAEPLEAEVESLLEEEPESAEPEAESMAKKKMKFRLDDESDSESELDFEPESEPDSKPDPEPAPSNVDRDLELRNATDPRQLLNAAASGRTPTLTGGSNVAGSFAQSRRPKPVQIASDRFYHKKLLFEEPLHERHGLTHGPAKQLAKSAGVFFAKGYVFPAQLLLKKNRGCQLSGEWEGQGDRICGCASCGQ